jgi:hypothetical protein
VTSLVQTPVSLVVTVVQFALLLAIATALPALLARHVATALGTAGGVALVFAIFAPILLPQFPFWSGRNDFLLELVLYVGTVWAVALLIELITSVRGGLHRRALTQAHQH